MATFTINEGLGPSHRAPVTHVEATVDAYKFVSHPEDGSGFVDFLAEDGTVVYRIVASQVITIQRYD